MASSSPTPIGPTPNCARNRPHVLHFDKVPLPPVQPEPTTGGKVFSYQVGRHDPPQWAREAVIYHIFSDRFHPGDGRNRFKPNTSAIIVEARCGVFVTNWITSRAGRSAIWLSPTWPSTSYHGYDVIDYQWVFQRLGGNEAMHALTTEAHRRGVNFCWIW